MRFNRDNFQQIEAPNLILCKASRERVGVIPAVELTYDKNFEELDEVKFKTYLYPDGQEEKNPVYDLLDVMKYIEFEDIGFFYISSIDKQCEGSRDEYVEITARSYEGLLGQKYLDTFVINMGTVESVEQDGSINASNVRFYQPGNHERSLLHLVMDKCPEWDFGHIDASLMGMERSFEIDRQDIYSFLMDDVANAFRCFFIWDTKNMLVHAYATDNYGEDTNVYINFDKLLKDTKLSYNIDDIKTCATVSGSDDMNLREINMGFAEIYNFDYYNSTEFMSESLYEHFNAWQRKYEANREAYNALLVQRNALFVEYQNITTQWPPYDSYGEKNYQTWIETDGTSRYTQAQMQQMLTEYGYDPDSQYSTNSPLGEIIASYQGRVRAHEEDSVGYYDAYGTYTGSDMLTQHPDHTLCVWIVNAAKAQAAVVTNKINNEIIPHIEFIDNQMKTISEDVDIKNNLTQDDLKELSSFIREDEISSDNFVITDIMTEEERLEMQNSLMEYASEELAKAATPQLAFDASVINLFAMPEFDEVSADFDTGNYIWVSLRDDYNIKAKVLKIHFNFYDLDDFTVEFGNIARKARDEYSPIQDVLKKAASTATTVSFGSSAWNAAKRKSDTIGDMLNAGLVDAGQWLHGSSDTSEMIVDERGITVNTTSGRHTGDGVFMGGGRILFTDDNWDTISEAIGRVNVNGNEVFGVLAQAVVSGQIYGTNIVGGSITGTDISGVTITGTTIKSSNYSAGQRGFILRDNGTFEFRSSNSNDYFILDEQGNLKLNGGIATIGGFTVGTSAIYSPSTKSTFSSNTAGVYLGTNGIKLGSKFSVDTAGNVTCGYITATGGKIGGLEINSSLLYSGGMNIGSNGFWNSYGGYKFNTNGTFTIGSGNNTITWNGYSLTFGSGVTLNWSNNISGKPTIPTDVHDLTDYWGQKWSTQIGESWLQTTSVYAQNLHVYAAKIEGTLSASQIDTSSITMSTISNGRISLTSWNSGVHIDNGLSLSGTFENDPHNLYTGDIMCYTLWSSGRIDCDKKVHAEDFVKNSDRRIKYDIRPLDDVSEEILLSVNPLRYKFKSDSLERFGLIAQDLRDLLVEKGLNPLEYGMLYMEPKYGEIYDDNHRVIGRYPVLDEDGNQDYEYGVCYEEFIMLNTHMIQKAYKRIEALEAEIARLKGEKNEN